MAVLAEYHFCLGALIEKHEGTLERYVGDGLVVVFNDPLPNPSHTERAALMAIAMRDAVATLKAGWQHQGHSLGFGIGMARGHATIGRIGFERRSDYAVIGTVPNLAARLCEEAKDGQILLSQRAFAALKKPIDCRSIGELQLKGFHRPMPAFEIVGIDEQLQPEDTNDGHWGECDKGK
jgi:class 3 adenylate cyclase